MFKKGTIGGFFKKGSEVGHLGLKALHHPVSNAVLNSLAPNSAVAKVSNVLQKVHK